MKKYIVEIMVLAIGLLVRADLLVFSTEGTSTGDNLLEISASGSSVEVAEISDLDLTASFGAVTNGIDVVGEISLSANGTQLGIKSPVESGGQSFFDPGEWLEFSFDKDMKVTLFKFANFGEGDSVKISWGDNPLILEDKDLNYMNEYAVNWTVRASGIIRFDALSKSGAGTADGFGLEKMDLTVVPEPTSIGLLGLGGLLVACIRWRRRHF